MRNYDYGIASPQHHRMKTSILQRPKSQQARISLEDVHRSPNPVPSPREEFGRKSFQSNTAANQYYMQTNLSKGQTSRQLPGSFRKISQACQGQTQKFSMLRKYMSDKIERCVGQFRQLIFKQSGQIMQLQRTIQRQDRQIENKNAIIQSLIQKYKQHRTLENGKCQPISNEMLLLTKVKDLEQRVRLITSQLQQEKEEINGKVQQLTHQLLQCFGNRLTQARKALALFMASKEKSAKQMDNVLQVNKAANQQMELFFRSSFDLKSSSGESIRDTCSSANNSKESLHSERANSKLKKDDSIFSDYFFHPSEPSEIDSPNVKAVQQLTRGRQQLPIRIFLDTNGRLKYWQSRTYLFDRRGNFMTATQSELTSMQRRGWLKLVKAD